MGLDNLVATYADPDDINPHQAKMRRTAAEDVVLTALGVHNRTDILDLPREIISKTYTDAFPAINGVPDDALSFIAVLDVLNASVPKEQMSHGLAMELDRLFVGLRADDRQALKYYRVFVMLNGSRTCRKSAFMYATPDDEEDAIEEVVRTIAISGKHMTQRWAWFVRTFNVPQRTPEDVAYAICWYPWPFVKMLVSLRPTTKRELLKAFKSADFRRFNMGLQGQNADAQRRAQWMIPHFGITKNDFIHAWYAVESFAGRIKMRNTGYLDVFKKDEGAPWDPRDGGFAQL